MRAERIASGLGLITAAALVLWVRLVPLGLPAVDARAASAARQRHTAVIAALERRANAAIAPAERAARVERAVDRWIEKHPEEFAREVAGEADGLRAYLQGTRADGRPYTLLGDLDSYLWLREARTILRTGSGCREVVNGECRDTARLAPVGSHMRYGGSLHTAAIVAVHRIATWFDAQQPLPLSAYWVHVIVGVLGVFPAFAIGRRLAGPLGGLFAAVASALHPVLLQRSLGSDNDVWNAVLPLYMAWALIRGLDATRLPAQLGCAALAGAVAGLHAAIWSGWLFGVAVMLGGLAAAAALQALRALRPPTNRPVVAALVAARAALRSKRGDKPRDYTSPGGKESLYATLTVAVVFYACAGVGGRIAGSQESAFALPLRAFDILRWAPAPPSSPPPASAAPDRSAIWPSAFDTVSELWRPNLGAIASNSFGALLFFVGWLGLLLLVLPRAGWQLPHFIVLIAGTLLYGFLITAQVGAQTLLLLLLLLLPLAAAVVLHALAPAEDDAGGDAGAALLVVAWLVGALFLSFQGYRFILLLASPLGITAGVAVGRLHLWLDAQAARQRRVPPHLARALVAVAAAALVILPARVGHATAAGYTPLLDRAWVDTLESLRANTPPETIVNTWWDYGYWAAYVAERRVSADGSSLRTRVPYWLARAQLAPDEAQTVGLLRMLNCGSDAQPFPEGVHGARAKLENAGLDDLEAALMIDRIAPLSRADADAELARHGLADAARAEVLASTHCTPPDSYLVLSTDQQTLDGWWHLGTWDPRRSYLARALRVRPEDEAVGELVGLGYAHAEARDLYRQAHALKKEQLDGFIAPRGQFLTPTWIRCEPVPGREWRCRLSAPVGDGRTVEALVYPTDSPGQATLEVRGGDQSEPSRLTPGLVLVAGPHALEETAPPAGAAERLAVLIDPLEQRALVGTTTALRSTYTALMHLDGRYAKRFRKVDEQSGYRGERVVTWRIDWDEP